jgi:WD40 repeat protein
MKTRRSMPSFLPEEDTSSEIEEEFKPPQRRLTQILVVALVLIAAVSALVIKVMGDQRQQANNTAIKAVAAQSTAVAQVTAMANELRSISATVEADNLSAGSADVQATSAELRSHDLAYAALSQLDVDPERAILIALEANQAFHSYESEDALRRALSASHLRFQLSERDSSIVSAALSPNGRLIVTVSTSGVVGIWSLRNGQQMRQLNGHTDKVLSAQFSPDSRDILTTSADKTARLWDVQSGSTIAVMAGHTGDVTSAHFSSDGTQIVTGSRDETVRIWNTGNVTSTVIQTANPGPIGSVQWSPDDERILALSQFGLSVWTVLTGKQLFTIENTPTEKTTFAAAFSPDGRQLVVTGSAPARLLDANTGQLLHTFDGIVADTARFSPDGQRVLTGGWLWDVKTGQPIYPFPKVSWFAPQFSVDGRYLVTQGSQNTLSIWDIRSDYWHPQPVATLKGANNFVSAQFAQDSRALLSVDLDGSLSFWRVDNQIQLPADYNRLIALAKRSVTRQLTCTERQTFLQENVNCTTSGP